MSPLTITIDCSELQKSVAEIAQLLETGLLEQVPQGFLDSLLALVESGLPDCIVAVGSTAPVTGNHIIVLGIAGKLKELAATARALKFELTGGHIASL